MIQNVFSIGVSAGTEIKNTAYLNYVLEEVPMQTISNELVDIVDQKLDMTLVCQESTSVMVGVGETKRAMGFLLNNSGNGEDVYVFTHIEGLDNDFSVSSPEVYVDDGDGIFSVSKDTLVTEFTVLPDENVFLFLVSDIPNDAKDFSSNGISSASKKQGSLVYGEFKKLDDFYVVVGTEEKANSALCSYEVPKILIKLAKKATLSSDKLYRGTTIHYEIAVVVEGIGRVENIWVQDLFPEGTIYVQDSLRLDGTLVGDATAKGISVYIPEIVQTKESSEPVHTVSFDVRVQ